MAEKHAPPCLLLPPVCQAWAKLLKPAGAKKPQSKAAADEGPLAQLRGALQALPSAGAGALKEVQSALGALLAPSQQEQVGGCALCAGPFRGASLGWGAAAW
jgi:hypothetical protein